MLFCYLDPVQFELTKEIVSCIERINSFSQSGFYSADLASRLYKEVKATGVVTVFGSDVDQIIEEYPQSLDNSSSYGYLIRELYKFLAEKTTVDLRSVSWEQVQTLGCNPGYRWKDPKSGEPWPTVKLKIGCNLIMQDGREITAYQGDYIVMVKENPLTLGKIGYLQHEIGDIQTD